MAITVVKSPFTGKEFAIAQLDCVSSDVVRKSKDSAKFDSFNLESPQLPILMIAKLRNWEDSELFYGIIFD
ncbi:hypothetical protein Nepgr_018052 [Nepenthes gracilis]|uniref:Uncharacterized protein n=1 Tax=Nepenthes gracilis TaxID=150966 RepID=A0AAD3ST42_NEPGR|nr:hypothetical protein Nepgr_018052 [Nepenthes gracilis]